MPPARGPVKAFLPIREKILLAGLSEHRKLGSGAVPGWSAHKRVSTDLSGQLPHFKKRAD
ncbi:MAG: hypothetical protein QOJ41_1040 [Acidobacteriaceae bacterium]|jgi:hypothetical protein|nr:hypothetical protein [Acidobacteriaceae bacterium]